MPAPDTISELRRQPIPLDSVMNGTRIRLVAPGIGATGLESVRAGVLEGRASDTLLFGVPNQQLLRRVPFDKVIRLEAFAGQAPSGGRTAIGAVVGLAVGLGVAQLANAQDTHDVQSINGVTIGVAAVGAVIGGVFGHDRPADIWRPVVLPPHAP